MPRSLNAYRTQDNYTDAGTLKCPMSTGVNLYVSWSAIYYQLAPEELERGEAWQPEVLLPRGVYFFSRRLSAIRVRSALSLVPAVVTVEAVTTLETG